MAMLVEGLFQRSKGGWRRKVNGTFAVAGVVAVEGLGVLVVEVPCSRSRTPTTTSSTPTAVVV